MTLVSTAAKGGGSGGGLALIRDQTLGADAANIDFVGIPSTYSALHIVAALRSTRAANVLDAGQLTFNGDGGANYQTEFVNAAGAGLGGVQSLASTACYMEIPAATSTASWFGAITIVIPNYASTTQGKTLLHTVARVQAVGNATLIEELGASLWNSTAAINRLTFFAGNGNLLAGSRVTLYGLAAT